MKKLTLMKKFMTKFVGKGVQLNIVEKDGNFKVHTIEIMKKTDETCPVEDISVGEYFLHLVATNPQGNEASIVCNWSDDLLQSLMTNYKEAKEAECSQITMLRDPSSNDSKWLLTWGNKDQTVTKKFEQRATKDPIRYIT